jgi:hypothetical protein
MFAMGLAFALGLTGEENRDRDGKAALPPGIEDRAIPTLAAPLPPQKARWPVCCSGSLGGSCRRMQCFRVAFAFVIVMTMTEFVLAQDVPPPPVRISTEPMRIRTRRRPVL